MVDRLELARQALDKAEKDTTNWAGPCHACKHWQSLHHDLGSNDITKWDKCTNEIARLQTFTPHGGYDAELPKVRDVRDASGVCGPEGVLFESRKKLVKQASPVRKTLLQRLFG